MHETKNRFDPLLYLVWTLTIAVIVLICTLQEATSDIKSLKLDIIDKELVIERKNQVIFEMEQELEKEINTNNTIKNEKLAEDKKVSIVADFIIMQNKDLSRNRAIQLARYEIHFAEKYNLPLDIAIAITNHESHFRCGIVSYDNSSYGCKQINVNVWKSEYPGLNFKTVFDPKTNIAIGTQILSSQLKKTGSIERAIKKYRGSKFSSTNNKYYYAVMKKKQLFASFYEKRIKEET